MKRIIVLVTVSLVTLTGCKKNRNCNCLRTSGEKELYVIVNESKNGADNICTAKSNSFQDCQLE